MARTTTALKVVVEWNLLAAIVSSAPPVRTVPLLVPMVSLSLGTLQSSSVCINS